MLQNQNRVLLRVGLSVAIFACYNTNLLSQSKGVPDGFERILNRGMIASIDNPQFVSAAEAEIKEDAWVFGLVLEGQARAYSLNLLNHHEVVNDVVADQPLAAVW